MYPNIVDLFSETRELATMNPRIEKSQFSSLPSTVYLPQSYTMKVVGTTDVWYTLSTTRIAKP
ncbi:hypothetical protein M404DRAFT_35512 [Pisolithus tinctorius Marx 270]|uniref:Uncharacterized protein n=1 Tax=Pisolithus tinctorius Marx 270 TaxID=870435 RepID=A0A0C3NDW8_PISTI|nr:hypothetical protein M404DRAFT_35512 [Pisolithus tinctorius Marx 270]